MMDNDAIAFTRKVRGHEINSFNREHVSIHADEADASGASHYYSIGVLTKDVGVSAALIHFQQGPVREVGFNGLTDESLLAVVLDRIQGFQRGPFGCRENAIVVTKLQEAMHWLRHRAEDRETRGVEGTNKK